MAQDFRPKRLALAEKMVADATAIVEAIEDLQTIAPVLAESGAGFNDGDDQAEPPIPSDFAGSDIQHLNAFVLHVLRDLAPRLAAIFDEPVNEAEPEGVKIGAILRAVKRG